MNVCLTCYETYDTRFLHKPNDYYEVCCPKLNCDGDVVELDELIAPTIILLNLKGYYTKYCCSGHWYDDCLSPYIYFHEDFLPGSIPNGFTLDNPTSSTIRARYDENSEESKYDFVIRVNKELHNWALELKENEELE